MTFNSVVFLRFLAVVLPLYWILRGHPAARNVVLLAAGLVFYGYSGALYLSLLLASAVVAYAAALWIEERTTDRGRWSVAWIAITVQLLPLAAFKYAGSFSGAEVLLPLGISFYTFQSVGYLADVAAGRFPAERNVLHFGVFKILFPQLVAGPIERAGHLLPQVRSPRPVRWEQINAGVYLIVWGYCKKILVADNLNGMTSEVFLSPAAFAGLDLVLGAVAFTIQLYADFSGYTDIARGVAKLLGFDLAENFRLPLFASSPRDFWSRWHISLSSWFRDYLYAPLALRGARVHPALVRLALAATMVLIGLWHGARWTFILFGAYHALLLLGQNAAAGRRRPAALAAAPRRQLWWKVPLMFAATCAGMVIFRANSAFDALLILSGMGIDTSPHTRWFAITLAAASAPLVLMEGWQAFRGDRFVAAKQPPWARGLIYGALALATLVFGARRSPEFIYFGF